MKDDDDTLFTSKNITDREKLLLVNMFFLCMQAPQVLGLTVIPENLPKLEKGIDCAFNIVLNDHNALSRNERIKHIKSYFKTFKARED